MNKEGQPVLNVFITKQEEIKGALMQLAHAFTQAVAEDEEEIAREIIKAALLLKEGV